MPELPEVEQARRFLEINALNRKILSVEVFDSGVLQDIEGPTFAKTLTGRSMTIAGRHGKQMFIGLDDGSFLTIHLGMTGDLILNEDSRVPMYSRIAFRFEGGESLFYSDQRKFGAIGVIGSVDQFVKDHKLGPDALCISLSEFKERVSSHKKAIKSVLLDQSIVSGIGNLYADEVLFQVRLHPGARTDTISSKRIGNIHRLIGIVLRGSIAVSSDFASLPDGYLLRAREVGVECPRHNGLLAVVKVGGRTSIFCPKCQRPK